MISFLYPLSDQSVTTSWELHFAVMMTEVPKTKWWKCRTVTRHNIVCSWILDIRVWASFDQREVNPHSHLYGDFSHTNLYLFLFIYLFLSRWMIMDWICADLSTNLLCCSHLDLASVFLSRVVSLCLIPALSFYCRGLLVWSNSGKTFKKNVKRGVEVETLRAVSWRWQTERQGERKRGRLLGYVLN